MRGSPAEPVSAAAGGVTDGRATRRRVWPVRLTGHRCGAVSRRLLSGAIALAISGGPACAVSLAHSPQPAPQRNVVLMFAPHVAFGAPDLSAVVRARIPSRQPITGERTALPVIARKRDRHGTRWLRVMLPGRPNGSAGWIREYATRMTVTPWHLLIDLTTRRVTVYLNGQRQRSFAAVIGKPTTPTPTGSFFVQETVSLAADQPGGPFALALSARSNVLSHFDGGPGQIAVHGRNNLGGTLGAAQSHGCVRVSNSAAAYLARWIGPGVPVTIYRD